MGDGVIPANEPEPVPGFFSGAGTFTCTGCRSL